MMEYKIIELHFLNEEQPEFKWIKISAQQDCFIAKLANGLISIYKIKDKGHVLNFVLDPNISSIYWNNEETSEKCQQLVAQTSDNDIVVYAFDDIGIRVHQKIYYSSIKEAIDCHFGDEELVLVGCERGYLFMLAGASRLLSLMLTPEGSVDLRLTLQLPQCGLPEKKRENFKSFQIVNGSVVILDSIAYQMYIYSVVTESCVCQVNMKSLSIDIKSLVGWRISFDLSVIMFLFEDWSMLHLNISEYHKCEPENVICLSTASQQNFNKEYTNYHLCRYGDMTWKREVVEHHIRSSKVEQVVGFNVTHGKKNKRLSVSKNVNASIYEVHLALNEDDRKKSWQVLTMEASSDVLVLCLKRLTLGNNWVQAVCFANFVDKKVQFYDIGERTSVILSDGPTCSHVLLSNKCLRFISPFENLQKDDFISWVMSYSGPSGADSLCQANQWTRTSVPLHTIEASLQQRQLDTLAFYFKSKQDLFSSSHHGNGLWNEVRQLQDTLKLVTNTISSNLQEPQAKLFEERLLSITLEFIYGLLDDARRNQPAYLDRMKEVQKVCDSLLSFVPALRKSMAALQHKRIQRRSSSKLSNKEEDISSRKNTDSLVTTEYLVKINKFSQAQVLLMSKQEVTIVHFREVIADMLKLVSKYLENNDISNCQQILNNMGCDVTGVLWSLIQYNSCRGQQTFVMDQLAAAAALSPVQHDLVQYFEQLYQAYPTESFCLAVQSKSGQSIRSWANIEDPIRKMISVKDSKIPFHCGDMTLVSTETETQMKELYVSVNLACVSQWSTEMRKAVIIDAQFIKTEDVMLILKSDPNASWQYLMSHNLIGVLLPFLESLTEKENFPFPSDPTQYLRLGWSHYRKEITKQLLRLKKLNIESLADQNIDIYELLAAVGGPLQKQHPFIYSGQSCLRHCHTDLITQFVGAGLQLPLWMYCTTHSINPNELSINHGGSWFPVFQAIFSLPKQPTDKNILLSASLLAAADLWSMNSNQATVEMMLEKNQILAAIGTLCYMTNGIPELNAELLEKNLLKYPHLLAALTSDGNEPASKYSTSVYQLLMGTSPFDIRRLFGWQTLNIFAGEDSPKIMPHFSDTRLTAVHSRHQKLSFPYYLKHGRPVYAFLSFLSEELDRSEASLSQKRIHQACGAALWIACQNFNTPSITSACVVFVELFGQDSSHVRTMLNVGRILLTHKHKCVGGSLETRQELLKSMVSDIVSDLLACVRSSQRYGHKLVKILETAIEEEIKLEVIGRCSYEAAQKWIIVLLLCEQFSLPMSNCFLKACAETDNWLMFLWFAQLHQYPPHQLQNLLQSFRSPNLRDHLHYVINNADSKWFSTASASLNSRQLSAEKKSSVTQRSLLYNKIGLQKSREKNSTSSDEEEEKLGKTNSFSSFASRLKQSEFNDYEMHESTAPDDVFRMLFYSQSMPSNWKCLLSASIALRNPLFAELASCCGCPALPSICGWLLASMPSDAKQTFLDKLGQNVSKWTTDHLLTLIEAILLQGLEDSLATAFIILQPLSPLLPFFCFITEFVKRKNYQTSRSYIDQFKDAMATMDLKKCNEKVSEAELPTVGDRVWYEKVTYQVLKHELNFIGNLYEARHLLEILDKKNICLIFSFDVLDFSLLHKIVSILHVNSVPCPQLGTLLVSGTKSEKFMSECEESVNYLISCGKFSEAQELAKLAGISREGVTIGQLKEEKERLAACGLWSAKFVRVQYWSKCKSLLMQAECSSVTCCHFYQAELQETSIEFEKALLCQHWLTLLSSITEPENINTSETIFRNMWRHRIAAKMSLEEQEPLDHIFDYVDVSSKKHGDLKSDLMQLSVMNHCGSDLQGDLNAQEIEVLDLLMGSYLDDGRITDCSHVAAVFGHYNQDLAIIQTCIALAIGQVSVDTIEPAMRRLLIKSGTQRSRHVSLTLNRSFSVSSISSGASNLTDTSTLCDASDIITVMEKLYLHCVKGNKVCLRIITCYKISQVLGIDYKQIVITSEFDSLRKLLIIDYPNKFVIAKDFLTTSGLSEDEVAGFLADSIVNVLKTLVQAKTGSLTAPSGLRVENTFKPEDGMEALNQFLKLTENSALLGNCILQSVATLLTSDQEDMSPEVLKIQTELIIMAHECYTIASNMEGISHVLRAARVCCDCLAAASEYSLMIRLLTGVGRYSEMQYIFHALQQNHQFELLLRKGMDREDKLKVAILDYLKRYQPDDSEAYTMVALKFTMYRDIAAMLETCGHKFLRHFKDKLLDNSKENQEMLKKCLQYFQDAAASYVKDNSIRKAQHCVKMARLISLQLQFLPNSIQVVELSKEQVTNFVNTHNRFIEAMVVSEAYERHADWVEAVLNNVILNGDIRYLQEMKLHVKITPTMVEDVIKRYKQTTSKSNSALQPIKKLLSLCKDIQIQYRLATELGLGDVVTSLLKGDSGSFLQDVTLI